MARRRCPKCNTSNRGDATFCRHCGEKLTSQGDNSVNSTTKQDEESPLSAWMRFITGVILCLLFFGGIVCFFCGVVEGLWLTGIAMLIAFILNALGIAED